MVSSTAHVLTVIAAEVLARKTSTSGNRRVSHATMSGPAVPNSISTKPMAPPAIRLHGRGKLEGCEGAVRSVRMPTPATYIPKATSGQRLDSCCVSHKPSNAPTTTPGSKCLSSCQWMYWRFIPPSNKDAGRSNSRVSVTTSAKGQCQASKGTMIRAEPKPVMPSTVYPRNTVAAGKSISCIDDNKGPLQEALLVRLN